MRADEVLATVGWSVEAGPGFEALGVYRAHRYEVRKGAKAKPSARERLALLDELDSAAATLKEAALRCAHILPDVASLLASSLVPLENVEKAIARRRPRLASAAGPRKRGRPRGTVDDATRRLLLAVRIRADRDADVAAIAAALLSASRLDKSGWPGLLKRLRTAYDRLR